MKRILPWRAKHWKNKAVTELLYRDDPYMRGCAATVSEVLEGGVVLNRTVFFAAGGGQPGDVGLLCAECGDLPVTGTIRDRVSGQIVHLLENATLQCGDDVRCELNWRVRHEIMRTHTAMHLLAAAVDAQVTGGNFHALRGRLDFDMPVPPQAAEIDEKLAELVALDAPVTVSWVDQEYLRAHPELVKTMSVRPPDGAQRVSLVSVEGVDLQACGGTHVASTAEIGCVRVRKIEKKGRINRRIGITVTDA